MNNRFELLWTSKAGTPAQLARFTMKRTPLLKEVRWYEPPGKTVVLSKTSDVVRPYYHSPRYIIDIESWPTAGTDLVVAESVRKYLSVINAARSETPDAKMGMYSMVPGRAYDAAVDGGAKLDAWTKSNARLQQLANALDFFCPSVYLFHPSEVQGRDTAAEFPRFADGQIDQARRLSNGKPIIPFLWPTLYHNETGPIPQAVVEMMLRHLYAHPDVSGIGLWLSSKETFDETAPWHQAMRAVWPKIVG